MKMKLKLTKDRIDLLGNMLIYFIEEMENEGRDSIYKVPVAVASELIKSLAKAKINESKSIKLKQSESLTLHVALQMYRGDLLEVLAPDLNALSSEIFIEIDQKL